MMKIKAGSFGLGFASGLVILALFAGISHLVHPVSGRGTFARGTGFGQNGTANLSRLSQRLGISQDTLQQELTSGKTIQQIMQENGVMPSFGRGQRNGSGAVARSGSGALRTGSGSGMRNGSSSSAQ